MKLVNTGGLNIQESRPKLRDYPTRRAPFATREITTKRQSTTRRNLLADPHLPQCLMRRLLFLTISLESIQTPDYTGAPSKLKGQPSFWAKVDRFLHLYRDQRGM
jgi:hypothetical protein